MAEAFSQSKAEGLELLNDLKKWIKALTVAGSLMRTAGEEGAYAENTKKMCEAVLEEISQEKDEDRIDWFNLNPLMQTLLSPYKAMKEKMRDPSFHIHSRPCARTVAK